MSDMLVNLLMLPEDGADVARLKDQGINIRRVQPYEVSILRSFIRKNFGEAWADEAQNAFSHQPPTCFIATHEGKIVGFAAYECTRRDFFGPTGTKEGYRKKGIGRVLLLTALRAMYEMGYVYAIIGGAGPVEFYEKAVGATVIPDSTPGIYTDFLDREQ